MGDGTSKTSFTGAYPNALGQRPRISRFEERKRGKEAVAGLRRPSPEDRALLGNGERQGERGFPLGRARGPAATEKRGEGDPIPVGAFSHRQFSSKLERQPKDIEVHRTSAG